MQRIFFDGSEGALEGRYLHNTKKNAPIALCLHPHPVHGGTMNNKSVYLLHQTFADYGFSSLRFNFRGVGQSEGQFDEGRGELLDAIAALDWLLENNPNPRYIWVAGFSFGAWIAMQLIMQRKEIERFYALGTPAGMYDFDFLDPCPIDGLFIHGRQDEITPLTGVQKLYERLADQGDIQVGLSIIEDADHFFTDHQDMLKQTLIHDIKDHY